MTRKTQVDLTRCLSGLLAYRSADPAHAHVEGGQGKGGEAKPGSEGAVADGDFEEEDGEWYLGRAKEEYQRRLSAKGAARGPDHDDPIQVRAFPFPPSL